MSPSKTSVELRTNFEFERRLAPKSPRSRLLSRGMYLWFPAAWPPPLHGRYALHPEWSRPGRKIVGCED